MKNTGCLGRCDRLLYMTWETHKPLQPQQLGELVSVEKMQINKNKNIMQKISILLTEHIADVTVFGEWPELILPPREVSVVIPGKFHHLQGKNKESTRLNSKAQNPLTLFINITSVNVIASQELIQQVHSGYNDTNSCQAFRVIIRKAFA